MTKLKKLKAMQASLSGQTMERWDYVYLATKTLDMDVRTLVEVGVFRGEMSQNLRRLFPQADLYLIDPWLFHEEYNIPPAGNAFEWKGIRGQSKYDQVYRNVCEMFRGDDKVHILREFSRDAAFRMPDDLDVVFIDANHAYEYVCDDVNIWLPKVCDGGLLCGHDYKCWSGVRRAVNEMLNYVVSGKNKGDVWVSPQEPHKYEGKNLVVLAAFGKAYQDLARMLVASLRTFGYGGEIRVFTERLVQIDGADVDPIIGTGRQEYIRNKSGRDIFRNTTDNHEFDYIMARMCIDLFIDLSPYRYVLYLDCDVMAGGNITPLFYLDEESVLCLGQKHRTLWGGCGEYLSQKLPSDKQQMARKQIKSNAGIVGIPAHMVKLICEEWRKLYNEYIDGGIIVDGGKPLNDEHIFNYMLARGDFNRVLDDRVGYKKIRDGKLLYHFIGPIDIAQPRQQKFYEEYV